MTVIIFGGFQITKKNNKSKIGEIVIDAYTTEVLLDKTTKQEMLEARLLGKDEEKIIQKSNKLIRI